MGTLENTKRFVYLPVYLPYLPNTKSTKRKRESQEFKPKKEEKLDIDKQEGKSEAKVERKEGIKEEKGEKSHSVKEKQDGKGSEDKKKDKVARKDHRYKAPVAQKDAIEAKQIVLENLKVYKQTCHRQVASDLKDGILTFNAVMLELKDSQVFERCEIKGPPASFDLITHILEQSYARSIAPKSHLLNNYEGFSNNVYGEIKHTFVHELIREANIKATDIFLDMGSGIGNVVLQIAAECLCESYGIEIMEIPSNFAKKQRNEFLSRMRYYAKPCGRIYLKQGDFLEDESISKVISKADVIFVNNYAFDPALNHSILAKFLDLKESAKIITLKSFVPLNSRQQNRRVNAIESIFTVKEYHFARNSVSWMPEGGSYYIHTVDRTLISGVSFV
ncbi:Nucleosomal histone H3-Lys79 methylase [Terramyces sp. JEL0728]|nr:Nucleosomal histone H3-Lys79 methylase [Terramyces sp. JEL0728]